MTTSKTPLERFESFFTKEEDACWIWRGGKDKNGYGYFKYLGKTRKAHRVSWEFYKDGNKHESLLVCHSCDNPSCVNPYHLWLGTPKDNMEDKVRKGRWKGGGQDNRGKKNPNYKHGKRTRPENRDVLIKPEIARYEDIS